MLTQKNHNFTKKRRSFFSSLFVFVFLVVFLGVCFPSFSLRSEDAIKKEIQRVKAYLVELKQKHKTAQKKAKIQQFEKMLIGSKKRLKALEQELKAAAPVLPPADKIEPAEKTATETATKELIVGKKEVSNIIEAKQSSRAFGFGAGTVAGLPAIVCSVVDKESFNLPAVDFAFGFGYVFGNDANSNNVSHFPLFFDAILQLEPDKEAAPNPYLGLGLNFDLFSSVAGGGLKVGSLGTRVFFGLESKSMGERFFIEGGYEILRTGYSPDARSLGILAGYRFPW